MFSISRFGAVMKQIPRPMFDRAAQRCAADKHRKGFSSWQQLVAMVYAQLSQASSLRTLEHSFNAHSAHHYHLGCRAIRRSTLAEANERSALTVFHNVAEHLMQQVQRTVRREGTALLQLIDSTSLTLKGPGFDGWTGGTRTRHTQGLKLHVSFDLNERAPVHYAMSAPNVNDIEYARRLALSAGVIYVFDKAYCDYRWWWQMTQQKVRFVSRFKRNARLSVRCSRPIPTCARGIILKDEQVYLSNKNPGAGRRNPYSAAVRRIEVARAGKAPVVLVTNDLKSSALRIAEAYKARWQIELFFKWIKQHLRIKSFLGRSENAVRIQIVCALIAYLLTHLHAKANAVTQSLWLYLSELRSTLFQRPQSELYRHRRWRERRGEFLDRQHLLFA
jgi:putative transposase